MLEFHFPAASLKSVVEKGGWSAVEHVQGAPGPTHPVAENVYLTDSVSYKKTALGMLYLTTTHVVFMENAPGQRKSLSVVCLAALKRRGGIQSTPDCLMLEAAGR